MLLTFWPRHVSPLLGSRTSDRSISRLVWPLRNSRIDVGRVQLPKRQYFPVETPGSAIRGLYNAFNDRNATAAAEYLDDDCVYEDLLLGPNTICRGKDAFASALKFHPAFVTSSLFSQLPIALPPLKLVVDSVAEGHDCVGVEWHVEIGTSQFPLGRGLSQAKIDPDTGKILRVVDIAEAPWRVIGIALTPLLSLALNFFNLRPENRYLDSAEGAQLKTIGGLGRVNQVGEATAMNEFAILMKAVCSDGQIHPSERQMVRDFMTESNLAPRDIVKQLQALGWTVEEWDTGVRGD